MALDVSSIASSILTDAKALLEAKATGFLSSHPGALEHMTKMSGLMAEMLVKRFLESDPAAKLAIEDSISDLKDALKEEALSIIVDVEATAKSLFLTILEDIGRLALGLAPVVLKAVTGI